MRKFKLTKETAWEEFTSKDGFYGKVFASMNNTELAELKEAFNKGWEEKNSGKTYNTYLRDTRHFGNGINEFGMEDFIFIVNCYVAGSNYRIEEDKCQEK